MASPSGFWCTPAVTLPDTHLREQLACQVEWERRITRTDAPHACKTFMIPMQSMRWTDEWPRPIFPTKRSVQQTASNTRRVGHPGRISPWQGMDTLRHGERTSELDARMRRRRRAGTRSSTRGWPRAVRPDDSPSTPAGTPGAEPSTHSAPTLRLTWCRQHTRMPPPEHCASSAYRNEGGCRIHTAGRATSSRPAFSPKACDPCPPLTCRM
jgi:hypothetical protein